MPFAKTLNYTNLVNLICLIVFPKATDLYSCMYANFADVNKILLNETKNYDK